MHLTTTKEQLGNMEPIKKWHAHNLGNDGVPRCTLTRNERTSKQERHANIGHELYFYNFTLNVCSQDSF